LWDNSNAMLHSQHLQQDGSHQWRSEAGIFSLTWSLNSLKKQGVFEAGEGAALLPRRLLH
jgi:hypothetical protein